jgi:excinuclease UvrABC nuclease subunit
MREAAADERFEEAARYRNRLFSIRHLADRQAADRRDVGSVTSSGSRSAATGQRCRSSPCATGR